MTVLAGALTTATSDLVNTPGANQCIAGSDFVAVANGTATSMTMGVSSVVGNTYKMAVYDAAGTSQLGVTTAVADSSTVGGLLTINLASSFSIVSGTTYKLRIFSNGTYVWGYGDNTGFKDFTQDATYPTWPGTITSAGANGSGAMSITVDGSTGSSANDANFKSSERGNNRGTNRGMN